MKILWYLQKACGRKRESNNQLCLALAITIVIMAMAVQTKLYLATAL